MILETLFLVAAAAFPAAPDTLLCREFQLRGGKAEVIACTQAVAAPWVLAAADTGTVRFVRDSSPEQEPMDVGAAYRGTLQLCVVLDDRRWDRCGVYLGKELLGVFSRASWTGPDQRRNGAHVEDGKK